MAKANKSAVDIQREIAEVELETKQLQLEQQRATNADYRQREAQRHAHNRQRQAELAQGRAIHAATVKKCRHMSGGTPHNIHRGGRIGAFSIISRAIMPDGVTMLLQCPRCRMKAYGRKMSAVEEAKLQASDPKKYAEHSEFLRLMEVSIDQGLEFAELRGPTFMFQNSDGVPIIPEML